MLELHQPTFWGPMDTETQAFVQEKTTEIRARMNRTAEDVIAIGQALAEVKARLPLGQYQAWLQSEFDMSHDSALNFMRVAKRFGEGNRIIRSVPMYILYELAKPSTPDEVIEQVTTGQIPPSLPAIREAKAALLPPPPQPAQTLPQTQPSSYEPMRSAPAPVTPLPDVLPAGLDFMAPHITTEPEISPQQAFSQQISKMLSFFQSFDDEFIAEGVMASTDEQVDRYETFANMLERKAAHMKEQIRQRRRTVLSFVSRKD